MDSINIRPIEQRDRQWIKQLITAEWGADLIAVHGEIFHPAELPGFVALLEVEYIGLITYNIAGKACEIISLNALKPNSGIGSRLIEAVKQQAGQAGCQRLWLITTNDNLNALGFYQKRGFRLSALHAGGTDRSRQLKPQIPLVGQNGIPIHDEIELEMDL